VLCGDLRTFGANRKLTESLGGGWRVRVKVQDEGLGERVILLDKGSFAQCDTRGIFTLCYRQELDTLERLTVIQDETNAVRGTHFPDHFFSVGALLEVVTIQMEPCRIVRPKHHAHTPNNQSARRVATLAVAPDNAAGSADLRPFQVANLVKAYAFDAVTPPRNDSNSCLTDKECLWLAAFFRKPLLQQLRLICGGGSIVEEVTLCITEAIDVQHIIPSVKIDPFSCILLFLRQCRGHVPQDFVSPRTSAATHGFANWPAMLCVTIKGIQRQEDGYHCHSTPALLWRAFNAHVLLMTP